MRVSVGSQVRSLFLAMRKEAFVECWVEEHIIPTSQSPQKIEYILNLVLY